MIAIHTNVLLRYLLDDDAKQSPKAVKLISKYERILITDIVLSKTILALKGKKYNLKKDQLIMVIEKSFKEPCFEFEDGQTMWRALNHYPFSKLVKVGKKKKDLDFSDALILEKSKYDTSQKKTISKSYFRSM